MPDSLTIKLHIKNPETTAVLKRIISAVPGLSISTNGIACDVIFMEIGYDLDEEFQLVDHIKEKGLARAIFLTSSRKDPDILLKALKTGVKEFFPQPINQEDVIASLLKAKRNTEAEERKKKPEKKGILVAVIGSKGGVGATTTAVNLSVSLKEAAEDKSVALIDMNPLTGDVPLFLDIKSSFSWADAAKDIARMDTTYIYNALNKHALGIHVLSAPSNPVIMEAATPQTMASVVTLMKSAFDLIVMDGSKSFDGLSLKMLDLSEIIIIVSELTLPSVVNTKKLLETLDGMALSRGKDIKIIINRYHKEHMISREEAEKTIARSITTLIPNDYETTLSAINKGTTLADVSLKPAVMTGFRELAALLLKKDAATRKEKSGMSLLEHLKDLALRVHKQDLKQRNSLSR